VRLVETDERERTIMMKAIAFAFLYGASLWTVYWRGWKRGVGYTLATFVNNLVKREIMERDHAIRYVTQISTDERGDENV